MKTQEYELTDIDTEAAQTWSKLTTAERSVVLLLPADGGAVENVKVPPGMGGSSKRGIRPLVWHGSRGTYLTVFGRRVAEVVRTTRRAQETKTEATP